MSYFVIVTDTAGQGGINPRRVKVITSDDLSIVTSAGYLNGMSPQSVMYATDVVDMVYSYSTLTNSGTYSCFTVGVNGGVFTLSQFIDGGNVLLPVVSGHAAIFNGTSGQIEDAGAAPILVSSTSGQTSSVSTSSATPGTIPSLKGLVTKTGGTMTSGGLIGVDGEVNCTGVSGGFVYGVQGKVSPVGTLGGTSSIAAVFAQLNLSGTVGNGTILAGIWADMGASAEAGTHLAFYGIAVTNTTTALTTAQLYLKGGASNLFKLDDQNGTVGASYFVAAGTTAGSAGDTSKCNASKVLTINVNGVNYWIPLFASNS